MKIFFGICAIILSSFLVIGCSNLNAKLGGIEGMWLIKGSKDIFYVGLKEGTKEDEHIKDVANNAYYFHEDGLLEIGVLDSYKFVFYVKEKHFYTQKNGKVLEYKIQNDEYNSKKWIKVTQYEYHNNDFIKKFDKYKNPEFLNKDLSYNNFNLNIQKINAQFKNK